MSERWHSVEEVADHLGIAQDTVRRWIESRDLPAHRLGKLWKFNLGEVDDWVRANGAAVSSSAEVTRQPSPRRTSRTSRTR